MNLISFTPKPLAGGVFEYGALNLKAYHKAIRTFENIAAQTKAAEVTVAAEQGFEAIALLGEVVENAIGNVSRQGLQTFAYHAELFCACVERVEIGEGAGVISRETVYRLFMEDPGLLMAWQMYATKQMVSASEGNAFALSLVGNGAGALNTVEGAGS